MVKVIKVHDNTHQDLVILKAEQGNKSIDETINKLLKEREAKNGPINY